MPYTQANLEAGLSELRRTFQTSLNTIDHEYQDTLSWLENIASGLRTGQIPAARNPLAPRTPARRPHLRESSGRGRNLSNVWSDDSSNSLENSTKSVSSSKTAKPRPKKRSNDEAIEEEDSPSKFMRLDSSENETRHLAKPPQSSIEKFTPMKHTECVKVPVRHSKRISKKQSAASVNSRTPLGELPNNKDLSARISSVKEESEGNFSPVELMCDSTPVTVGAGCTYVKAPADSTTSRTPADSILGSSTAESSGEVVKGTHNLPLKATRGPTAAIKAARKSVTRAKIMIIKSSGLEDKSKPERGHLLPKHVDKITPAKHQQTASASTGKGAIPASDSSDSDHTSLGTIFNKTGLSRIRTVSASSLGLTSFINKPVVTPTNPEENLKKIAKRVMDATKKRDDLIKMQIAEKARSREQKRQRVLSARDEMERERALIKVQLDRAAEKAAAEKAAAQKAATRKAAAQKAATRKAAAQKAAAQKAAAEKAAAEKAAAEKAVAQKAVAQKAAAEKATAHKAAALDRTPQGNELNQTYYVVANKSAALNETFVVHGGKIHDQTYDVGTYDVTLAPEDREPIPPKTEDDYGLDDVHTDDSSDDEMKPKKVIPKWALDSAKLPRLQDQIEIPQKLMAMFFESKKCTPDLSKIFTHIDPRQLIRRSSAVWTSPKQ